MQNSKMLLEIFVSIVWIIDIYQTYILFYVYLKHLMKEKPVKKQPDKAQNIIIYAGDLHSQVYRKFLKDVFDFEKIEVAGKASNS
jgi:hypothetical protein